RPAPTILILSFLIPNLSKDEDFIDSLDWICQKNLMGFSRRLDRGLLLQGKEGRCGDAQRL
ncbi:MAG TPA: hypothetical protein VKB67_06980, partial [Rhizomicrobium sp.]|nr:hypothetical protein [Rhizomicrobium sp.]